LSAELKTTEARFQPNSRKWLGAFNAIEIGVVLLGLSLSSTGTIGMIVGVPLILGAIYSAFFIPSKINRGLYLGKCPHCGADVSATHYQTQIDCPSCTGDIAIRDNRFVALPKPTPGKAA
jgi:predicted RNA-binding Zn-ribbon protein involved in translation (DUF1610 family)